MQTHTIKFNTYCLSTVKIVKIAHLSVGLYVVLLGYTWCCWVIRGTAGLYVVLLGYTWCCWVIRGTAVLYVHGVLCLLTLQIELAACPKTSVNTFQSTPRNNPEE